MGLLKVTAFDAGPKSSGISISQGETREKAFFRVSFTLAAQNEIFGRPLDSEKDAIAFTVTNDQKHCHLMGIKVVPVADDSGISLSRGVRGSVSVKLSPWRQAQGKRPAASLQIVNRTVNGGGISVKLPELARATPDLSDVAKVR
jgi:hypothetical protein